MVPIFVIGRGTMATSRVVIIRLLFCLTVRIPMVTLALLVGNSSVLRAAQGPWEVLVSLLAVISAFTGTLTLLRFMLCAKAIIFLVQLGSFCRTFKTVVITLSRKLSVALTKVDRQIRLTRLQSRVTLQVKDLQRA